METEEQSVSSTPPVDNETISDGESDSDRGKIDSSKYCEEIPNSKGTTGFSSYKCTVPGCSQPFGSQKTGWKIKQANTSFRKHLRTKHPEIFGSTKKRYGSTIDRFFIKKEKPSFNDEGFEDLITRMIVCRDLPFRFVETPEFIALVDYLRPGTYIIKRTKLRESIKIKYQVEQTRLINRLQNCNSRVSITCDLWTSKNQLPFFGVTVHYIDDNWVLRKDLLDFKHIPGFF